MAKKKLKIVSLVRVNGKIYRQEELDPDEFRRMVDEKVDEVMRSMGFTRDETA